MIPKKIAREIAAFAKARWPDDKEMQAQVVSEETEAYAKLQLIDFGDQKDLRSKFIDSARAKLWDWGGVYKAVQSELIAYRGLLELSAEGVSEEVIELWKIQAAEAFEGSYSEQFDFVQDKARKLASIIATRLSVDPLKKLLIELENIVGNECYNGNIQNYSSWGELESEGRQFRYPVRFYSESGERKEWSVSTAIDSEELITGHYVFGANELNIYRALLKVVFHLRDNYGLKV